MRRSNPVTAHQAPLAGRSQFSRSQVDGFKPLELQVVVVDLGDAKGILCRPAIPLCVEQPYQPGKPCAAYLVCCRLFSVQACEGMCDKISALVAREAISMR